MYGAMVVGPQIGEIEFTELVVCQQIDGMYFTDGGRYFTDCFVRVLVCEEDEDKNGPLHRNEMLVFRCSKGINRF